MIQRFIFKIMIWYYQCWRAGTKNFHWLSAPAASRKSLTPNWRRFYKLLLPNPLPDSRLIGAISRSFQRLRLQLQLLLQPPIIFFLYGFGSLLKGLALAPQLGVIHSSSRLKFHSVESFVFVLGVFGKKKNMHRYRCY